jgi:hypothetical protein
MNFIKNEHYLNTPYDYQSVMHYDSFVNAKKESKNIIYKKFEKLSEIDVEEVRTLYKCRKGIIKKIKFKLKYKKLI